MRVIAIIFSVLFLLVSCTLIDVPVPPRSMSVEDALRLLSKDAELMEIQSFMGVRIRGKAVKMPEGTLYAFKFKWSYQSKLAYEKITRRFIFGIELMDSSRMGKFVASKEGNRIVIWWKGKWLMALVGDKEWVKKTFRKFFEIYK